MKTTRPKKNRILKVLLKKILLLIIILIVIFNLIFFIFGPIDKNRKIFGNQIITAKTNSMEPAINKKDLVIIKKVAIQELEKDDIIIYQKGNDYRITRIINTHENRGIKSYLIKADNNYYIEEILGDNIQGKVIKTIADNNIYLNILRILSSKILTVIIVIYLFLLIRYKRRIKLRNEKRRELQRNINTRT